MRHALIETALIANQASSPTEAPILVLGGDLSSSTWGVAAMARETFHYLKNHPWVQILTGYDLLSSTPVIDGAEILDISKSPSEASSNSESLCYSPYQPAISTTSNAELLGALHRCLLNTFTNTEAPESLCEAAWQAYLALFSPIYPAPAELPDLRANYVGQVWSLLEVAHWAEFPTPRSTCDTDPDRDG